MQYVSNYGWRTADIQKARSNVSSAKGRGKGREKGRGVGRGRGRVKGEGEGEERGRRGGGKVRSFLSRTPM